MARLLRMHFASIGHRDARLAPLTLDFRHAGDGGTPGRAADTVLWLRNGGGKSSILNLFYSVFRPSAREFLGSSAEGRARKLGDYVEGRDLAYVITEWDVEPADGLELFGTAPSQVRLAGQVLAWKGQRRSADVGNLRRLFFSMRAGPGLSLDALPVQGLGEPVESFDAFRQWLRDAGHAHGAQELVYTENQKTWLAHLEKVGLDPELFRYQLRMNQREGAADEVFRFTRDEDFVRFLLELALEPEIADGVAQNLTSQQQNLRLRPTWELERRFVGAAVGEVRGLAEAVRSLRVHEADYAGVTREVAAIVRGLEKRATACAHVALRAQADAESARERLRAASNLRDAKLRWARGLERRALLLDVAEARTALEAAEAELAEVESELAHASAARALVTLRAELTREAELKEALARERAELEPLRRLACERGSVLYAHLERERSRCAEAAEELARKAAEASTAAGQADERHAAARERRGRAEGQREILDARIHKRDAAREALLRDGVVERREAAAEASARWTRHVAERDRARASVERERGEAIAALDAIAQRRERVLEDRAEATHSLRALEERLDRAVEWRDRLAADPRVVEVEEVDTPDLEAPGLADRLRRRAGAARAQLLASRVEGAEDERSLEWLREHGLLPSPVDVRRVVEALQASGHPAHAGPSYLEQNLPSADVPVRLAADPARFAGVVVTTPAALARAAQLAVEGLRAPVQVSLVASLDTPEPSVDAHVVLPDPALWDRAAADDRQRTLQVDALQRAEREREWADEDAAFTALCGELHHYLEAFGGGVVARLAREVDEATERARLADQELQELRARQLRTREVLDALEAKLRSVTEEHAAGTRALAALERFFEEHERDIEDVRRQKDEVTARIAALASEAEREKAEAARQRELAASLRSRGTREEQAARDRRLERDAVLHLDERSAEAAGTLDEARAAYETARADYEGELTDSRIRWELERCEATVRDLRASYHELARGLEAARVERFAAAAELTGELQRFESERTERVHQVARRRATHERAERVLEEQKARRRDVDDLPADRPPPEDAESARRVAAELEAEAEVQARLASEAQDELRELESAAQAASQVRERSEAKARLLEGSAQMAGVQLPDVSPRELIEDDEGVDALVEDVRARFRSARERLVLASTGAERAAGAVRDLANRTEFATFEAQYRERMKDPAEELFAAAADLAERLDARLSVVDDTLAKLDEDRRLIVEELLHLADAVSTLFRRAESASKLPSSLEGWGGRSYLRLGFSFPDRDDERRARLEPLVDRLVAQAQLPTGLELVVATATELAGPRGFDVKILKPDTVLRPDPIPLSLMSTFSRGQQLTAAILLYCTLVQLRARTRGRAHASADAGVLILDNPIGTCSNVALLRLQQTIAARMRVQLVYTTGVDDLDALAILPNKIRLRNSHRDRATGHYHVTEETDGARGGVEGVRLVEVPAR